MSLELYPADLDFQIVSDIILYQPITQLLMVLGIMF